jgi:hypothetical protein
MPFNAWYVVYGSTRSFQRVSDDLKFIDEQLKTTGTAYRTGHVVRARCTAQGMNNRLRRIEVHILSEVTCFKNWLWACIHSF